MGDYYNILHTAKEEAERIGLERGLEKGLALGLEQGREQGLEQGREEQNLENAKKLKELGVDIAIISQATGFDPQTIEEL